MRRYNCSKTSARTPKLFLPVRRRKLGFRKMKFFLFSSLSNQHITGRELKQQGGINSAFIFAHSEVGCNLMNADIKKSTPAGFG